MCDVPGPGARVDACASVYCITLSVMRSAERPVTDQMPTGRVTVREAAKLLGITVEAVRGRTKRGTLRSTRDEDGTVYVFLEGEASPDQTGDRPPTGPQPDDGRPSDRSPLVEALQAHIDQLQRQLEEANRANAEHRRLLAAALERIPELEGPSDPHGDERGGVRSSAEASGKGAGRDDQGGPENGSELRERSWWRRFFGIG